VADVLNAIGMEILRNTLGNKKINKFIVIALIADIESLAT